MQIDPRRLAVLLGVHRAGSVTGAAKSLHLTASAVSQQIARLERETGVAVLERQPSGVVLTAAGLVLVEAAERIESELLDTRRALADLDEQVTGTVAVAAFQTVVRGLLVPMMASLAEALPGVDVLLHETSPAQGTGWLRAGTVDLLLLEVDSSVGRTTPRGQHDVPVLDEPWLVLTPTSLPRPTTLGDLASATWLETDLGSAAGAAIARLHASFPTAPAVRHRFDDYDVAIEMVAVGLGVTLLPSLAVRRDLPETVRVTALPGLGARRIVARHRTSRAEPRPEVRAVLAQVVATEGGVVGERGSW